MAKRAFDVAVATALLVTSLPLWPVIAISIVVEDGFPILYRSQRVGRDGKLFTLLKFRTMHGDAGGPAVTEARDPRITRVGRWLRDSKLDELPQLLNVLRGDMSVVGPRPEDPRYVARYTEAQRAVLRARPGITSPAAVQYRHEERILAAAQEPAEEVYLRDVLPAKLELDLAYLREASVRNDLKVLAATARVILARG